MSIKSPTGRLARWALQLQPYNLHIDYIPGKTNIVADGLSRPPIKVDDISHDICVVSVDLPRYSGAEIRHGQIADPEIKKIIEALEKPVRDEDAIYWSNKGYFMSSGMLYRYIEDSNVDAGQLVIPQSERLIVLKQYHDEPSAGHYGADKTFERISRRYYWQFIVALPVVSSRYRLFVHAVFQLQNTLVGQQKLHIYRDLYRNTLLWPRIPGTRAALGVTGPRVNRLRPSGLTLVQRRVGGMGGRAGGGLGVMCVLVDTRSPCPNRRVKEPMSSASIRDGNITGSEEDSTLTDRSAALDQSKRKRFRKVKADGESSSETPSGKVARRRTPKVPKEAKSGCEPTPSTSHYAGVGEAQQKLSALKRQQKEKELEERAAAYEQKSREAKRKHGYGTPLLGNKTVPELQQVVLDETSAIAHDASRCSNMKGTIQKAFKERAANLRSVMEELLRRSLSEETLRMQATIDRLSAEVAQLRSERSMVRCKCTGSTFATVTAVAPAPAPATAPSTVPTSPAPAPSQDSEPMDVASHAPQITPSDFQEALRHFGLEQRNFVRAAIAGLEDRLLPAKTVRPPLAADRKNAAKALAAPAAEVNKPPIVEPPKPSKGKGKGKKTKAPANASVAAPSDPEPRAGPSGLTNPGPSRPSLPPQEEDLLLPSTTAANNWQVVEKKKKKKKKVPAAQAAAPKPATSKSSGKGTKKGKTAAQKAKQILTPPKTAAVIVTISPEAAKRGETYQSVLERARASVVPAEMGIPDIKCRQTVTGARMFEIPGAEREGQADLFAQRMQEAVAGVATVARPQKLAPLMISEMDDSVTKVEVIATAARIGGCAESSIKSGEVRTGRGGRRAVYVQLPVAAAKILLEKRRIPLGLSSAAVRILDQLPMRCYRCYGTGHTSALCPSVDRTGLCLRCGQADHKAATCKARQAKCAVCTASKVPAGHVMGGPKCNPPAKRGKPQAQSTPAVATAEAQPEPAGGNGNLNHCRAAQDLMAQTMASWTASLAVVAEPYSIPSNWLSDLDSLVAIVPRPSTDSPPLSLIERGHGYVAAMWGEIAVMGVYFSPNRQLAEFEAYLAYLAPAVARMPPGQVAVLGDLNARSMAWGDRVTKPKGRVLELWATTVGLSLLNRGNTYTCVRRRGGSIVDVSFATPALAARVRRWEVDLAVTLSDHRHVRIEIADHSSAVRSGRERVSPFPRWALTRLDREMAKEAAFVQDWFGQPTGPDVDDAALRLRGAMTEVCDASMPRSHRPPPKKAVYWWSTDLEDLRVACLGALRSYRRYRRRAQGHAEEEDRLYAAYCDAKKVLRAAIGAAKDAAREEMLESLNDDPWGRPYKAVRNKLRPIGPPLTETLQPDLLERVVRALFPDRTPYTPPRMDPPRGSREPASGFDPVSAEEFDNASDCLRSKRTAPGPDGVPARVVAIAAKEMGGRFRDLFDLCFEVGRFPKPWKEGQLCLLRKEGRPADSPSGYRPIVLLDEAGKLFERVIAARLNEHLATTGPNLADSQYGFRSGRSTIDAVMRLKSITAEAAERGDGVMAVSFDIANAFNSIPHSAILEALRYHGVPTYLRSLLTDYLSDREVLYVNRDDRLQRRQVETGVPQGSVLGPLLWNLGYNWLLRGTLLPGMDVICYADDTLITARGRSYGAAAMLASVGGDLIVGRIRRLGLKVALEKTEALFFPGPRQRVPPAAHIEVGGVEVRVKAQMKYLGLTLDGRWHFTAHFKGLSERLVRAADSFGWLLPNLGGPRTRCRRLYAGVLKSMALYGAPVWSDSLHRRENVALLRRPQRAIALRVARAYRTVGSAVLTGHGCFGNYLHKIGREESPSCHECGAAVDSAQHTLAVCPGWEEQRRVLVGAVGQDLSLPSIVNAMLDDERAWKAMASFCETVMSQKEAAEREREDDPSAPPLRRRRRGRRRRAYDRSSLAPPGGQQVVGTGVPPPALHAPPPSRGNSAVSPAIPPIPPSQGGGAGPAS
ncbi:hypothetical protein ABMA27_010547 [Loxostege sticticalis]|uniref:Reverse transcriptase domain-containing protein n=1 Tax=Loxostege sticticalis TaxID=481309 RepID=A0ABR3H610_LOXSC